jgi:phosphoribosylformylglycinamidine (FGAM) synthase-like enzyme
MGEACKKFDTPVTGGNVSFYNQNPDGAVYPTPTIGMVGLLDSVDDKMTLDFKQMMDTIYLVGKSSNDINCSDYLHQVQGVEFSPAPQFDLDQEFTLQKKLAKLIRGGLIQSAHDVSEGGLFVTLLESGFNRQLGFAIESNASVRKDAFLFGEAQSRVVVTVKVHQIVAFEKAMGNHPFEKLGTVTSGEIMIDNESWGEIGEWHDQYDNAIGNMLAAHKSEEALTTL